MTTSVAASPPVAIAIPTQAEMAESRRFRDSLGLRADDAWIAAVAANPASRGGLDLFGVPLLPFEVTDLMARSAASDVAGPIILDYAATVPDDWFGSYIDQQRGGVIVAEFFRDADRHRAALARLLPPSARWEVRQVDLRTADRIAFVTRVKADHAWLATIDAELLDIVTNPMDGGIVEFTYLAERRDLDSLILEHYGAPEWLRVERAGDPMGVPTGGDLVVHVVDPHGRPVPGLICDLGRGLAAKVSNNEGNCPYPEIAVVGYILQLSVDTDGSPNVVGSAEIALRPGRMTRVTVVVPMRSAR